MKKAHFVGICGVGMSATAVLLKEKGWDITGSDAGCFNPIRSYLIEREIPFTEGFSAANVPDDVDLVVGGASARLADNEEVTHARERGIPVTTFPELLVDLSADKETVLVAGSYGKSTMSSLVAWCLAHAGKDPSWFSGAPRTDNGPASHGGDGRYFVIEADEYITSGIDRRSKFLHFKADNVILIAAEHDHVNVFPTIESYRAPFKELLAKILSDGSLVACIDNPGVEELIAPHTDIAITYGVTPNTKAEWSITGIERGETTTATITHDGAPVCNITTTLLGDHNLQNIVGAAAFLIGRRAQRDSSPAERGEAALTADEFVAAVAAFPGIKRRMERLTRQSKVPVYEGYGSSYDKARSAIAAIRAHFPERRLVTVFEPHSINWRNKSVMHWYDDVFVPCAHTLVYKPASIGTNHDQATHEEIMERIIASGANARAVTTPEETLSALRDELKEDDVLLILTSGDMDGLLTKIPALADELFPA